MYALLDLVKRVIFANEHETFANKRVSFANYRATFTNNHKKI